MYMCLMDADLSPIMDLPRPVEEPKAPVLWNEPSSLRVVLRQSQQLMDELVGEGLGEVDGQGHLVFKTDQPRFVLVRTAHTSTVYKVAYTVVAGTVRAPLTMEVHGVDETQWVLGALLAPSDPQSWHAGQWVTLTRDEAMVWSKPRLMRDAYCARAATGFTITGPADDLLADLIQTTVTAASAVHGWTLPVVVDAARSDHHSEQIILRPSDNPLTEEVLPVASMAGVTVSLTTEFPPVVAAPRVRVRVWQEDVS